MQNKMNAAVIHRFGGPEEFQVEKVPIPQIADNEVLIKLKHSAVSTWDAFERQGGYAEMLGLQPQFPYILGSEGSGTVAAIGGSVKRFKEGDSVYTACFLNPKGGTYAEYAAVDTEYVSLIPEGVSVKEAGVLLGVGLTALRGLEDMLQLQQNETLLIFGASGGIGHVAVQLAKAMGAEVIAVASGDDGVALVRKLGIEKVVDGRSEDALEQIRSMVPNGFDAALMTAGGDLAQELIELVRKEGRLAYPNGAGVEDSALKDLKVIAYNGEPEAKILARLNNYIQNYSITAHIEKSFSLEEVKEAHEALEKHYSGKFILNIN